LGLEALDRKFGSAHNALFQASAASWHPGYPAHIGHILRLVAGGLQRLSSVAGAPLSF